MGLVCLPAAARVLTGIEVLRADSFNLLQGKRVGLVTNATGVDAALRLTADILYEAPGVQLTALFAPEHGIRGNVEAGGAVNSTTDPLTGLPVYSLYGKTRQPTAAMLEGLDVLVYDIQDIGCRSYTFISTLYLVMQEAAAHDIEVVVLDRPNPLGGEKVEGSLVDGDCRSFVSQCDIPYIYGLTVGELALYLNASLGCRLQVVPMQGWKRSMLFADTGLPWVPTSPHIPHAETALYYPATGILGELSALSIGVGYTLPFQTVAAPWIDADSLAAKMNALQLAGIVFRPIHYKPYYALYAGQAVHGVELHITDYPSVCLTEVQFQLFNALQELYPARIFWQEVTPAQWSMFDKVTGSKRYKSWLVYGPLDDLLTAWRRDADAFCEKSAFVHLYE
ncbi:MAG: DUF1343 domain-containing protein [Paludibacteraceae bacterium]|nr:DUF1343 domain-containing protein [Paludibacteraceae bacterium]